MHMHSVTLTCFYVDSLNKNLINSYDYMIIKPFSAQWLLIITCSVHTCHNSFYCYQMINTRLYIEVLTAQSACSIIIDLFIISFVPILYYCTGHNYISSLYVINRVILCKYTSIS